MGFASVRCLENALSLPLLFPELLQNARPERGFSIFPILRMMGLLLPVSVKHDWRLVR
jgi:hypothetical protein